MEVTVFAPASVSNVGCGYDVFGFAIERPGDRVTARMSERPGVSIAAVHGDGGALPIEVERNTAGVAARATLEVLIERSLVPADAGLEIEVEKQMPLASGLGSSAASAVAAVVAVDALFDARLDRKTLLRCTLAGETVASGTEHADNVAPSLLGGFVMVRSLDPEPDIVDLPVPGGLTCVLVRPEVAIETRSARELLGEQVPLAAAITQWANTAALVAALYRQDLELLSRALVDVVAEPVRAPLVPGFDALRDAARGAGALGCTLSGSGPTVFALCRSAAEAATVEAAMAAALDDAGVTGRSWTSAVGARGAHVVGPDAG